MRPKRYSLFSLFAALFMLAAFCSPASAALLDVGPAVPEVIGSSPPTLGHGFPAWYRDTNRLPLEPCLSQAVLPSGPACVLLPDIGFNPLNTLVFPTNFPPESFYFIADARYKPGGGVITRINYRAALEAAFLTGAVAPGEQITFARVRVFADLPVAGTYKITHPYGVETIVADTAGTRAIAFTRDIGIGSFATAVTGNLGPWLIQNGFPQTINGETFIGDPNIEGAVTGSPFGTNFVRVEGPVGANLDGLGHNIITINLFTVAGKVVTAGLPTPLTVDRATYTRDATSSQVEVFATTQMISNATTGLPPNPLALANIPSALEFTDATAAVPLTVMGTNNPIDGKFFGVSTPFANPTVMPPTVTVTNTADVPPSSTTVPLGDEVTISEASYDPATGTLRVVASSGDKLALPALTVSMRDGQLDVPLGTIAGGSGTLTVTFPLTTTLPAPLGAKTYNIPPLSVTVTSAKLGSDSGLVSNPLIQPPVAVNDIVNVGPGGTVTINVAANDTTPNFGATIDPASIAIVAAPTKGTVSILNGIITYTAQALATGSDIFTYTIKDTTGALSNVATVTVTINNPPVAAADAGTTPEDTALVVNVIANDSDPDTAANPLNAIAPASVLVTVQPANGTTAVLGNGTVRYTPGLNFNGADSFSYTVRDTLGAVSTAAAVAITVTPVPDAPLAVNDAATTAGNTAVTVNVLANDTHPDGLPSAIDPATLTIATTPAVTAGTATVVAGQVQFVPATNFFGTATFTYLVSDNTVPPRVSAPATVTVTVTPVNIPPTAANDVASTFVNVARIINVVANDTDPDGIISPTTVTIATPPAVGTATVNLDGTVTFTSATAGTGTFTYNVKDNAGAVSNNATVTVSVASAITDAVTVLRAEFINASRQWTVEGNTTNVAPASKLVTIHIGNDLTGQTVGTVATNAGDGRWKFQLPGSPGNIGPTASGTISVELPSGASRLAFPVAIK